MIVREFIDRSRYWPEIAPAVAWATYRSCKAWRASILACSATTDEQLRAKAIASTHSVYSPQGGKPYNLADRVRHLCYDEGTFRGVEWYGALASSYDVAEDEDDATLAGDIAAIATAIVQEYIPLVGNEPGKQWFILPLLVEPATEGLPFFHQNPQGQGLGNAALGLQALDASRLGSILARHHASSFSRARIDDAPDDTERVTLLPLVDLMEKCAAAAINWVLGLNPGVPIVSTSLLAASGTAGSGQQLTAASMVMHSVWPDGETEATYVLPWTTRWWGGGASCAKKVTTAAGTDTFAAVPQVQSIINGIQPLSGQGWTVGSTELYILHDGAVLQGLVEYQALLTLRDDII